MFDLLSFSALFSVNKWRKMLSLLDGLMYEKKILKIWIFDSSNLLHFRTKKTNLHSTLSNTIISKVIFPFLVHLLVNENNSGKQNKNFVIYFYPFRFLKIKTQLNPTQLSQTVVSPLNWFSYFSQVLNKAKCEFRSSEFFRFPMFSQPTNGASLPQFSKKHSQLRDTTQLGSKIKIKINNNFFSSSSIFSPTKR